MPLTVALFVALALYPAAVLVVRRVHAASAGARSPAYVVFAAPALTR